MNFIYVYTSLLKRYMSNGEAVDPQLLTPIGERDNDFEVERVVDFSLRNAHSGVMWRGVAYCTDARQPDQNIKQHAQDALRDLAIRSNLPDDIFETGGNCNRIHVSSSATTVELDLICSSIDKSCAHAEDSMSTRLLVQFVQKWYKYQ